LAQKLLVNVDENDVLQLSERGYKVTVLEKANSVASVSGLRLVSISGGNSKQ